MFDGLRWSRDGEWWWVEGSGGYRANCRSAWGNRELSLSADSAAPHFGPAEMSAGDATPRGPASGATERLRRALRSALPGASVYAASQSCFS